MNEGCIAGDTTTTTTISTTQTYPISTESLGDFEWPSQGQAVLLSGASEFASVLSSWDATRWGAMPTSPGGGDGGTTTHTPTTIGCTVEEDPQSTPEAWCNCPSTTLPTLSTSGDVCAYTAYPATTGNAPPPATTTTTTQNPFPYTFTDPDGDIIACATSSMLAVDGGITVCASSTTTIFTAPPPTPTATNCIIAGWYEIEESFGIPPTQEDFSGWNINYENGDFIGEPAGDSVSLGGTTLTPSQTNLTSNIFWSPVFFVGFTACSASYEGTTYTGTLSKKGASGAGNTYFECDVTFPCETGLV